VSNVQFAFLKASSVPTQEQWQQAIDRTGFDLKLDPTSEPRTNRGFVPCTLEGAESGVEMYFEDSSDFIQDFAELIDNLGDRNCCISFRWGGDMQECACAMIASLALAAEFGAIVSYQADHTYHDLAEFRTETEEIVKESRQVNVMPHIPIPHNWGSFDLEPFDQYRARWPEKYNRIPDEVIETWIHRHWSDFQQWHSLHPLEWEYEPREFTSEEVLKVSHVGNWMETLAYWGNDLLDGPTRKSTWLGKFILEQGTTPSPMIIARGVGKWYHPREKAYLMQEPFQLIEGHMRLAYLRALILRGYSLIRPMHRIILASIPPERSGDANHL
jgi:hypothetical protein